MPPQTHDRSFRHDQQPDQHDAELAAVFLPRQFNPIASQPLIALGTPFCPRPN
jgi:tagatose-6-phosphate ketose/aldose isomerase